MFLLKLQAHDGPVKVCIVRVLQPNSELFSSPTESNKTPVLKGKIEAWGLWRSRRRRRKRRRSREDNTYSPAGAWQSAAAARGCHSNCSRPGLTGWPAGGLNFHLKLLCAMAALSCGSDATPQVFWWGTRQTLVTEPVSKPKICTSQVWNPFCYFKSWMTT